MNPLTAVPPKVRSVVYWLYALIGVFLGGCEVADVTSLAGVDVTRILAVFAYVGVALGATAGSNVPSYADVVEGDVPPPDRGAVDVGTVLVCALLVVLILVLLGVIR